MKKLKVKIRQKWIWMKWKKVENEIYKKVRIEHGLKYENSTIRTIRWSSDSHSGDSCVMETCVMNSKRDERPCELTYGTVDYMSYYPSYKGHHHTSLKKITLQQGLFQPQKPLNLNLNKKLPDKWFDVVTEGGSRTATWNSKEKIYYKFHVESGREWPMNNWDV